MQSGKTPAILFSLPGNVSQLLAIDSREIGRAVSQMQMHTSNLGGDHTCRFEHGQH